MVQVSLCDKIGVIALEFQQKGFPLDATIDNVQTFMDQFGETEAVFMRRDKERKFKVRICLQLLTNRFDSDLTLLFGLCMCVSVCF